MEERETTSKNWVMSPLMSEPFRNGCSCTLHWKKQTNPPKKAFASSYQEWAISPCFAHSNLIGEVCVLEDMTSHLPVIEIRIEECRGKAFKYGSLYVTLFIFWRHILRVSNIPLQYHKLDVFTFSGFPDEGIDVRIRGLKIKSSCERDLGLNADIFQSSNLVRYPRLQGHTPDFLYRRANVIQR